MSIQASSSSSSSPPSSESLRKTFGEMTENLQNQSRDYTTRPWRTREDKPIRIFHEALKRSGNAIADLRNHVERTTDPTVQSKFQLLCDTHQELNTLLTTEATSAARVSRAALAVPELLQHIAQYVSPEDGAHLASTCSYHHRGMSLNNFLFHHKTGLVTQSPDRSARQCWESYRAIVRSGVPPFLVDRLGGVFQAGKAFNRLPRLVFFTNADYPSLALADLPAPVCRGVFRRLPEPGVGIAPIDLDGPATFADIEDARAIRRNQADTAAHYRPFIAMRVESRTLRYIKIQTAKDLITPEEREIRLRVAMNLPTPAEREIAVQNIMKTPTTPAEEREKAIAKAKAERTDRLVETFTCHPSIPDLWETINACDEPFVLTNRGPIHLPADGKPLIQTFGDKFTRLLLGGNVGDHEYTGADRFFSESAARTVPSNEDGTPESIIRLI